MSLQTMLESQDLTEALDVTEESMLEEHAMLEEALDDTFELPSEDENVNSLQFFNQDNAAGISDDDFSTAFHPDNTAALNDMGKGSGGTGSDNRSTDLVTQLTEGTIEAAASTEEQAETQPNDSPKTDELSEDVTTLSDADYGDDYPLTLEDLDDLPEDGEGDGFDELTEEV